MCVRLQRKLCAGLQQMHVAGKKKKKKKQIYKYIGNTIVFVKKVQSCSADAEETTDANSLSTTLFSICRSLVRSFCSSPSLTAACCRAETHTHTHTRRNTHKQTHSAFSGHSCGKPSQCQALLPYFGPGNCSTHSIAPANSPIKVDQAL